MVKVRLPEHILSLAEDYTERLTTALEMTSVVVLDIETDGLDGDAVWVVGLLNTNPREAQPAMLTIEEARKILPEYVECGFFFVIHNAKFDLRVLAKHGIHLPPSQVLDTMLLSYVADPSREGGHSLSNLGPKMDYREALIKAQLLDHKAPKGAEYLVPRNPVMLQYCATDLEVTRDIFCDLAPTMMEKDYAAWCLFAGIEMQFLPIVMEMERTGLHLDIERAKGLVEQWTEQRYTLAQQAQSLAGFVPGKEKTYKKGYHKSNGVTTYNHTPLLPFNPASNDHIAYALKRMGWKPTKFTTTGKPQTDLHVLNELRGKFELVDLLLEISHLDKLTSMVESYIEKAEDNDGWVRGEFNQALTRTGRLSSSNPNLQNIPGRGEDGELIRSLFTAPPGTKLIRADLSNIEARVLAHFLAYFEGDTGLAGTFARGEDFHQYNADTWKVDRTTAKTLLFASLYGAGPEKVGGGDKEHGQKLLDTLDRNMPSIMRLKTRVWDNTRKHPKGVIHTWFGRRLVYPDIKKGRALEARAKRQVFNAMLQGTSADILKMIAITVQREVHSDPDLSDTVMLCAQVHDEGVWIVFDEHVDKFLELVDKAFAFDYLECTPIKGEALAGPNWNDAHS